MPFARLMTPSFRGVLEDALQATDGDAAREEPKPSAGDFARVLSGTRYAGQHRAPWAVELGLELPCDEHAARRAFRRLALRTHPDRPGGSHQAFLRARKALEEALAALRAREPRPFSRFAAEPRVTDASRAHVWSAYA
jgi:hypothetical protein